MATVNVTFTTQKLAVPATLQPSSIVNLRLKQGGTLLQIVNAALPGVSGSFANVADGTYTVEAQRITIAAQNIGEPAVSEPFTVVNNPTVEIDVPAVVNVVIG
jgi:hypothetical protein